jgi:hypothetical protein
MKVRVNVVKDKTYADCVIGRCDTRDKIFEVIDTVNYTVGNDGSVDPYEKVRIRVTEYGEGKPTVIMQHNLDLDDFMSLARDIFTSKKLDLDINYVEYKGSKSDRYDTGFESRVLNISPFEAYNKGEGAYTISFTQGPGESGDKGAVSPQKGAKTFNVKLLIGTKEARKMFLECFNYLNSKRTAFLAINFDKIFVKHY